MSRPIHRLSARAVANAKPGMHADGGGLYLQVTPKLARSWIFRYTRAKRPHDMGLGSLHTVSLQEAREKALQARRALAAGEDPLAARRTAQAPRMTFGEAVDAYIAAHRAEWKNDAQANQWAQSLRDYGPARDMPVAGVDTPIVLRALEAIWTTKTETATRVRGRIERVLDWATVRKLREGENPARWKGHLDHLLPKPAKLKKVTHHAAMPYAAVPAFMTMLRARDGLSRRALHFTILTAARTSEVTLATWEEFDLDAGVWLRPAEHMKAGVAHRVPLVPDAIEILRKLPRKKPPFPLSENGMLNLLQEHLKQPYTVHGFRSSFRDWGSEETHFSKEALEMALAHTIRNPTEAAYRRGDLLDKRRELMTAWANYLRSAVTA